MTVRPEQRFRRDRPCPVCGGHPEAPHGRGVRCWGYVSDDGAYAHCTREERAGSLSPNDGSQTYAHRLAGECRCGTRHGADGNGVVRKRVWRLTHPSGAVVEHVREDRADGTKRMRWRRDGKPTLGGLRAQDLRLYGADELRDVPKGSRVVVVEGEKSRDALKARGIVAVATVTGAKGLPSDESLRVLLDYAPLLWPDAEADGRTHMRRIAERLHGMGLANVRILDWPDAPDAGDAADYFASGRTPEDFERLCEAAVPAAEAPSENAAPPDPSELTAVLDDVARFVRRFVIPAERAVALDAIALWTFHTHALGAAEATPYLHVTSAEKRSGKTRLLEVLELLVARPWLTGNVSAAVLARRLDRDMPTLLLDESDAAFRSGEEYAETLRGILNSGNRRGGSYSRCVGKGAEKLVDFSTFGPKAIAGIGQLPDTVADRSIAIRLKRRAPHEAVERFRQRTAKREAAPIREHLARLAAGAVPLMRDAEPNVPNALSDRAADGWEPLLAIADLAGGEWPERARRAAVALSARATVEDDSVGVRLLADCRRVFEERGEDRITTDELLKALVADPEAPWGTWRRDRPLSARNLADLLRPYGIRSKVIRTGEATPRGYLREHFEDAWCRYLPSALASPDPQSATAQQTAPDAENLASVIRNTDPHVADAGSAENPPHSLLVADVADSEQEREQGRQPEDTENDRKLTADPMLRAALEVCGAAEEDEPQAATGASTPATGAATSAEPVLGRWMGR